MVEKLAIGYRCQIKLKKIRSVLIAIEKNQSDYHVNESVFSVLRNLFCDTSLCAIKTAYYRRN